MPALMSVTEFVVETKDDFNSPTTSTFINKMPQCRQTVCQLEESLDFDRDGLTKLRKAVKAIYNGGNAHVNNEVYLSKSLERLGANAMTKDQEPDIGAAFIKFSVVTKELSALMKTLMQSLNNIIMFPLDNILKGDLKGVKGDLKKPFDKAWRDYETKITKIEKEKKQQAKEAGLIRTELSPAEIADDMDKERKMFQLQMCDYLLKVNEIKTKKGVELLQHLVDYYHAQTSYFQDGLKTIEHFNTYIDELSQKVQQIKQKQDEERKHLLDVRNLLKNSTPSLGDAGSKDLSLSINTLTGERKDSANLTGYSLHQMQGNKNYGYTKTGYLMKKSEGKIKVKVWQKRKCEVKDGFLFIYHSDEGKAPTKVNLLTCQVKNIPDEKKSFRLISCNRTYHFQTEEESDFEAWISVLINCKEGALKREFDNNSAAQNMTANNDSMSDNRNSQSLNELRQSIIKHVLKLPGNDKCVDCNSTKDPSWLSTNFGILTCIECSGIHRDLGVHISRIQSLTLDNIGTSQLLLARVMSNNGFNDVMEATLDQNMKPQSTSKMEVRYEFIRAKYVDRKYAIKSCSDMDDLKSDLEHAVMSRHLYQLLQAFGEGANLTWPLPSAATNNETSLHVAVSQEDGSSLHIVDFLVQNSSDCNKQTKDGNTALHLCVERNQSECMKLLLRSGASATIENANGKTPIDLAREKNYHHLVELLEHAAQNKKSQFDNVNVDWALSPEDASTDFSDEDLADDSKYQWLVAGNSNSAMYSMNGGSLSSSSRRRMRKLSLSYWDQTSSELLAYANNYLQQHNQAHQLAQSERNQRSRPSSVVGSESPSSRSSDSFKQNRKAVVGGLIHSGSMKKKSAPMPPGGRTEDVNSGGQIGAGDGGPMKRFHTRTPSDPASLVTHSQHIRNMSVDLMSSSSNGSSISEGSKTIATTKMKLASQTSLDKTQPIYASLQRPRVPPPPLPLHQPHQPPPYPHHQNRLINGQSNESLPSLSSETESEVGRGVPVPPPRKVSLKRHESLVLKPKRCRALYDCDADRDDELAFKEGEVIVIVSDKTDDEEWMEGMIESQPQRRGVFPTSFVHMIFD